jgi:hypothetical protein
VYVCGVGVGVAGGVSVCMVGGGGAGGEAGGRERYEVLWRPSAALEHSKVCTLFDFGLLLFNLFSCTYVLSFILSFL